jgi:hypothetical protein
MSNGSFGINKGNIDKYFSELAKEIKKQFGSSANMELIVVGGASVVINYGFRESTLDIDALNSNISSINGCIRAVADNNGLPYTWLNSDFKTTNSYSPRLIECSRPYKKFGNVLSVYSVKDEYLLCMKLMSFRLDKDVEDIEGIVQSMGANLSGDKIDQAMKKLYGGWDNVSDIAVNYIAKKVSDIPNIERNRESIIKKIETYKSNRNNEKSKKNRYAEKERD